MNINGNKKDNHKAKEEKGMNKNGNGTCLEINKFHHPAFASGSGSISNEWHKGQHKIQGERNLVQNGR
ncbi:hypothetical protein MTR_7g028810 [Medicago truncatula]|uniref:Uncharacterized protein n=1 Tax=Medicago truncatula TaxID=3880 RepID=A0A072TWW3_MEDTR|nr:hypothetical protein MTR_7g028810 [Medicago truncatula]